MNYITWFIFSLGEGIMYPEILCLCLSVFAGLCLRLVQAQVDKVRCITEVWEKELGGYDD